MLFNSFQFVLFILPVLALYTILGRIGGAADRTSGHSEKNDGAERRDDLGRKLQNRFLFVASLIFYGAWDWRFLALILASTVVDYCCGLRLNNPQVSVRRRYLILSLMFNLGMLGVFKYFNFFTQSALELMRAVGVNASADVVAILLPVGISFYTFQTLSYTIDVYQRKIKAATNFWDFALYVAFFPQLVAGPIEKARQFLPQIQRARVQTLEKCSSGTFLIFWGLFKKVFVADNCAEIVNLIFRGTEDPTGFQYLIGAYAFSWQIYCDFSGYSDIARGLARLMGFELMLNFNMPYFSESLSDFWRRWHISLSTWFKEYLYIPLGGNRAGRGRLVFNLMTVFVVSGLWHGAATNFLVWGTLHGVGLVILVLCSPQIRMLTGRIPRQVWKPLAVFLTFHYVAFAFAIWQTETSLAWFGMMAEVLTSPGFEIRDLGLLGKLAAFVAIPLLVQWRMKVNNDPELPLKWPLFGRVLFYTVCLFALLRFGVFDGAEFIYFQF